jgi:1,5-anhydro-D-fructose reductase (1,5-anhydro-D-mannitol-forming)
MTDGNRTPLKVGVMSFAHVHAFSYIEHLLGAPDVELLTSDPGGVQGEDAVPRGAAFAELLGAPYVDTYEELFAWGPDAVVVCTENVHHLAAIRLAAEAGAHVLCEKPLATTSADAAEIVRLGEEHGIIVMTAFPMRFTAAFGELAGRVRSGEAGDVLAVLGTNNGKIPTASRHWFTDPARAGGGALVDHVVHCADLLDALLEEEPVWVQAVANDILHRDMLLETQGVTVETGGFVTLGYPSGVVATIDCSWSQPQNAAVWGDVTLQVTATGGSLAMSAMNKYVSGTDRDGDVWMPFGLDSDGAMIDHFLDGVRQGGRPQPDAVVGARMTRIVEAAQESARTGRRVGLRP